MDRIVLERHTIEMMDCLQHCMHVLCSSHFHHTRSVYEQYSVESHRYINLQINILLYVHIIIYIYIYIYYSI